MISDHLNFIKRGSFMFFWPRWTYYESFLSAFCCSLQVVLRPGCCTTSAKRSAHGCRGHWELKLKLGQQSEGSTCGLCGCLFVQMFSHSLPFGSKPLHLQISWPCFLPGVAAGGGFGSLQLLCFTLYGRRRNQVWQECWQVSIHPSM